MTHTLTLQGIKPVTHDTYMLTFNRPEGFDFEAGQATNLAFDEKGWRDAERPFTMTSLPDQKNALEFVIKSYPEKDGVTDEIPNMNPGDQVIADDPFGAITDHGPGVFIAAGAGITPFIAILRAHAKKGAMNCQLIYVNETDADIILKGEFDQMNGLETIYLVSDQDDTAHEKGKPDKETLSGIISDFDQTFYICGPGDMVDDVRNSLKELGAAEDKIITEDGW
ncbi:hypothetical protein SAMN04488515_2867 [Cognatiyoonia koreensis]|uniref:FAD-binding FR-type domain-containing protein n=1 Tax=Cognatiyoonia koreensis TaxID=364200 RepID=A0A1I0RLA2_9RHOB|nr:FAD-binding oxidoreductase [Cognatiyoonia koreensis]SEW41695.1 hypothetical protein SAMN04488515_2867 [Cognatiyoonia koreensis]